MTSNDGIGGQSQNNYTYGGLKSDLKGRGSLGFRYQTVKEPNEDTTSTTFFRQDYPFIGMPCQTQSQIISTGSLTSANQTTYGSSLLTTGSAVSQFPYVTETLQQGFELGNSTAISTSKTTNQYDTYGNVTKVTVDSMDGHVKTTTNTYYNDSTNWILGRLLRSTVSSTTPYTTPTVTVPTAPATSCPSGQQGTPPNCTPIESNPPATTWTECATLWNWCDIWGTTKTIRFGAGTQWVEGTFTDGISCGPSAFGGIDPAPSVTTKVCQVASTTTAPTTTPNAAPTVSLTAPTSGSSVTSGTSVTVSATATDSDGSITKVEFYDGSTLIGTDTTSPYSISWSGAAVGSHSLTAKATDNSSAVTTSSTVSLTVTSASVTTLYTENFNGSTATVSIWGTTNAGVAITGAGTSAGKLTVKNSTQTTQSWPGFRVSSTYTYGQGHLMRLEATVATLAGLGVDLVMEGKDASGNNRSISASLKSSGITSSTYDSTNGWGWKGGGTITANTTYIIEFALGASGPTLYVYPSGSTRASGFSNTMTSGAWATYGLSGSGYEGSDVTATTTTGIDNIVITTGN